MLSLGICPPTMGMRYLGWIVPNKDGDGELVHLFGIGMNQDYTAPSKAVSAEVSAEGL